MTARHIYSTGNGMAGYPNKHSGHVLNAHGCSVAIARGSDGRFQIAVIGKDNATYAMIDRDELMQIADAITKELHQ